MQKYIFMCNLFNYISRLQRERRVQQNIQHCYTHQQSSILNTLPLTHDDSKTLLFTSLKKRQVKAVEGC